MQAMNTMWLGRVGSLACCGSECRTRRVAAARENKKKGHRTRMACVLGRVLPAAAASTERAAWQLPEGPPPRGPPPPAALARPAHDTPCEGVRSARKDVLMFIRLPPLAARTMHACSVFTTGFGRHRQLTCHPPEPHHPRQQTWTQSVEEQFSNVLLLERQCMQSVSFCSQP